MSQTNVLTKILQAKYLEVDRAKQLRPLSMVRAMAEGQGSSKRSLVQTIRSKYESGSPAVIAECKQRSPSKGLLRPDYDPVAIALAYQRAGAGAVSVLTDEPFFGGHLSHLKAVAESVQMPVLRKDFIIDEYQVYEARLNGADSFLLLAGVLDTAQLQYFTEIGRDFGMEPLIEIHSEDDLALALQTDGTIVGINNRNLKTMRVDLDHSFRLADKVRQAAPERTLVCESGVRSHSDLLRAYSHGFHACLVGEQIVTQNDPEQALLDLLHGS